jgi:hypothetical protein
MTNENMIEDMQIEIFDVLPSEERRRVLQQHLDAMVQTGQVIADVGSDGATRYWAPENYHGSIQ